MRVISGSSRGLRLAPPEGGAVRPTLDRVKEAAFNIYITKEAPNYTTNL